jgi:hypothetical protein
VLYALGLKVGEHYMRRHYGVVYDTLFVEGQHPSHLKQTHIDGLEYCTGVFDWVAKMVHVLFAELMVELHSSIWPCCKV